jgi:hypothetical protein
MFGPIVLDWRYSNVSSELKFFRGFLEYFWGLIVAMLVGGCGVSAVRSSPAEAAASDSQQTAMQSSYEQASSPAEEREAAPPAPPAEPQRAEMKPAVASMAVTQGAPAPGMQAPHKAFSATGANNVKTSPTAALAGSSAKEGLVEGSESGVANKAERAPLLIYKADIIIAVFEVSKGLDAVEKIAKDAQGYLVSRHDDSVTVRVPAAGFDTSLQAVLKLGDVLQRNLQVDDVTAEMNDLTTRLKNAEAMRARLQQLLSSAKTTDEALQVEEQLGRVTGEIESIKGKLRLMSELVSFSTITVSFRPAVSEKVNSKFRLPFGWLNDLGLSKLLSL